MLKKRGENVLSLGEEVMNKALTVIDRKTTGVIGVDASHEGPKPKQLTIRRGDRGVLIYNVYIMPHQNFEWRTYPGVIYTGLITARLHRCQNGYVRLV